MVKAEEDTRPGPPSWLDKDFIQRVLRSEDGDPTITVTSYEVMMANADGDGYLSYMYRIKATLQDSQERRVIVKCQPLGGQREELIQSLDAYAKETQMLSETLPAMHGLLEQAKPGVYTPFTAKCLYHGKEPIPFIVMEDLRQSGFTLATRQLGFDLAHCTLAMKTLARFHASSLALYDKNPEAVKCFSCPVRADSREILTPFYQNALRSLGKEVAKWPGFEEYVPKLNKLVDTIFHRVSECYTRKEGELNVLCHGDTWCNNMMFKYSNSTPEDMRLVDMQLSHFSSPALDLHYFLYSSASEEVRINHIDSLLQIYHASFTETLSILDCSKYSISLEQLRKIFKDYSFLGFFISTILLPVVILEPENSFDFEGALAKSEGSSGRNANMYENKAYVNAMKRMLPLFEKDGLLD
ncbi:uncharacterized protein [Anabrus simplex]|uniref:uncharacterized protein n=1 Tax=Anabrus simplex TaxID=316456 RepID=UPI0035A386B7